MALKTLKEKSKIIYLTISQASMLESSFEKDMLAKRKITLEKDEEAQAVKAHE